MGLWHMQQYRNYMFILKMKGYFINNSLQVHVGTLGSMSLYYDVNMFSLYYICLHICNMYYVGFYIELLGLRLCVWGGMFVIVRVGMMDWDWICVGGIVVLGLYV